MSLDRYQEAVNAAHEAGIEVGVELPAEPDKSEKLHLLLAQLHDSPVSFLNLNELEITVGNQKNMDVRGFNLAGGITAAAEGSAALAIELKKAAEGLDFHLKFCTASYKDAGQLRNRFRRRGEATLRPYEILSEDDTIVFGAIPCSLEDAAEDVDELTKELDLHHEWIRYNGVTQRIEIPLSVAEEIAEHVSVPVLLVEVHPTHERLEVGVVNLNQNR